MMTASYFRGMMDQCQESPAALASHLICLTSPAQQEMFAAVAEQPAGIHNYYHDSNGEHLRGALLCMLWRTLLVPDSTSVILTEERAEGDQCMLFLDTLRTQDPALANVTKRYARYAMSIANRIDWTIRTARPRPKMVAGYHRPISNLLVLGDTTKPPMYETLARMGHLLSEDAMVLQLW